MNPITRLNAALEGRYRLERELGEGGMATVYLADDLKHERRVALKVLKPELAAVVGADRFLAEIKTTANLQHPHILPLHDSGEADGLLYYVMPYVEGESLRDRLDREHQLPVDEAVEIASDVASALGYAHSHGVIHRDIKPANILLSETGEPLVSDFGIALAVSAGGGNRLTETGLSLGTPHYMSPEQATGDLNVGLQTDIYALGCVLYEMMVGEPPFTGSTPQAVLGKIITGETPSAKAERPSVPPNVDAVIAKALEKVPADRFQGGAALAAALSNPSFAIVKAAARDPQRTWWNPLSVVASAVSLALVAVLLVVGGSRDDASQTAYLSVPVPDGFRYRDLATMPQALAVSPDGSWLAYVNNGSLYLRSITTGEPRLIDDAGAVRAPVFSPDGTLLAWGSSFQVYSVPVTGGIPSEVDATARSPGGLHWSEDGSIYATDGRDVWRYPLDGGEGGRLFSVEGATRVGHAQALDDGRLILVSVVGTSGKAHDSQIILHDLETGEHRVLVDGGYQGTYLSSGHLIYITGDGTIMAKSVDLQARSVEGRESAIAGGVMEPSNAASAAFTVSEAGILAYVRGDTWQQERLVRYSRDGTASPFGTPLTALSFDVHPDGRRVAVARAGPRNNDIYLLEEGTGAQRLSSDPRSETGPLWAPDGSKLAWRVEGDGPGGRILVRDINSEAVDTLFEANRIFPTPWAWWPDGQRLSLWGFPGGVGDRRLGTLDLQADSLEEIPFFFEEGGRRARGVEGSVSPDGRWLAFCRERERAGVFEVFVARPDGSGAPQLVGSGCHPQWERSGERLFYLDGTEVIEATVLGESGRVAALDTLFSLPEEPLDFDATPDGETFMVKVRNDEAAPLFIDLVLGFDQELERLLPN